MSGKQTSVKSQGKPSENGVKVTRRKLSDYTLDPANPNRGSVRGSAMLEHSVDVFGPARSGVADKDGVIRAGNHTAEQLYAAGIEDVIEIEADGKSWVVVKRTDMDPKMGEAYSIADNRTGQFIEWDADVLRDLAADLDLGAFFDADELAALLATTGETQAPDDFNSYGDDIETEYCCPKCGYKWSGKPNADAD